MRIIKNLSLNQQLGIAFVISFLFQLLYVIFAPLTQDDGWYASYAYSFMKTGKYGPLSIVPEYNDSLLGVANTYLYAQFQILFFKIFGVNYISARLPSLLFGLISVYVFYKLVKIKFKPNLHLIAVVIFGCSYLFLLHTWARREMLALLPILISIYVLEKSQSKTSFLLAFMCYFIAFDFHPMSCALIVIYGIVKLIKSKDISNYVYAALGALLGLCYILGTKVLYFKGIGGFLEVFKLPKAEFEFIGDHFIPVFKLGELDLVFFIKTSLKRWWKLGFLFLASLSYILFILKKSRSEFYISSNLKFSLILLLGYLLITTLFFSTAGNGFQLYGLVPLLLCILSLYEYLNENKLKQFSIIFAILICSHSVIHLCIYTSKYSAFETHKNQMKKILRNNDLIAMSPLYFFEALEENKPHRFIIFAQIEMYKKRISFLQAIKEKKYTVIGLDENIYPFLYKEMADTAYLNSNSFYNKMPLIEKRYIDSLINIKVLVKIDSTYSPFVGGKYIFYKVNY